MNLLKCYEEIRHMKSLQKERVFPKILRKTYEKRTIVYWLT